MCQKINSSLVTIETLSGIKHTPGVTYPGGAAALTKAPRVRVGLPRPRAAWTAADTAAAAANAPLLYNTHTAMRNYSNTKCRVATDWFLEKRDELVRRFQRGNIDHRISNRAVMDYQTLTLIIPGTDWMLNNTIWMLLVTSRRNRWPTWGIIFFFLLPAAFGPEKSFSRAARAALALATFLLGPAPRNFCPSTSTCPWEHGMKILNRKWHQWLKSEMTCIFWLNIFFLSLE